MDAQLTENKKKMGFEKTRKFLLTLSCPKLFGKWKILQCGNVEFTIMVLTRSILELEGSKCVHSICLDEANPVVGLEARKFFVFNKLMMFKVDEGGAEGAVFVDFRSDQ
jgi:hypothetical protein